MAIIHALAGIALLAVSLYALTCSLKESPVSEEHWKILTVFSGLLLGFLLFTGFIQLGSRHSVHRFVLYKLCATVTGGIFLLLALVSRLKDFRRKVLLDFLFVLAIFLFGFSLFLGIVV